jgi:RHS repeat-associated protein
MPYHLYNAEGARVAKGSLTVFTCDITQNGFVVMRESLLGPSGEQLAELARDERGAMAWSHTNVYAAGALFASYDPNGLHFLVADWLGSRRAQTDSAGVLEQTCQSLPFGNGLNCTASNTAPTDHHFTDKERDTESGNDYFGARYYNSNTGRFLSPDWSDENDPVPYADFSNPQSLNLYSYAYNNPLRSADADGHVTCDPDTWDDSTNTLTAGACHYDLSDFMNSVGQIAQKTTNALSNAAQTVSNFVSTNQTLCQVAATAGGAAGGALAGGESGGALGAAIGGTGGTFVAPGVGTLGGGAGGAAVGATIGSVGGGIAGGIAGYAASNAVCSSGSGSGSSGGGSSQGSTGRGPKNLKEQLAAEQAASNPKAGRPLNLSNGMSDPRWPGSQGWVKMAQNVNGVEVHYNYNTITQVVNDIKIK